MFKQVKKNIFQGHIHKETTQKSNFLLVKIMKYEKPPMLTGIHKVIKLK